MKVRLLILGLLVHGLLLLWSFDISGSLEGEVSCPLPDESGTRRLLLVIVRNPSQRGPVEGINSQFFSRIPNVVYFGEDLIPIYFNSSENWAKVMYTTIWNSDPVEESYNNLITFKEVLHKLGKKPEVFFIVLRDIVEERSMLYIKQKLDYLRNMVDNYYGVTRTTCLLFYEENRNLCSFGHDIVPTEGKQIKTANLLPLVSTLLHVNTPYQSLAFLPLEYLNSSLDKAYGLYCNALNIFSIAKNAGQNTGVLKYLSKKSMIADQVSSLNLTIDRLLHEGDYTAALTLSKELLNICLSFYNSSVQTSRIFTFIFVIVTLVGWMLLLFTEYLELMSIRKFQTPSRSYIIHLVFAFLSLSMLSVPFLQKWPYIYHFYFQMPVLILWLISLRIKYFSFIKTKHESVFTFFLFLASLFLVEEYLLIEDEMVLPLSVCVAAMLPSWPTFRKVPFLFIVGWYVMSVLILGAIYLMKLPLVSSTKYVNLSGTIWLVLAGISILWISPRKDTIVTCFLTVCLGAAMWMQNACFSTHKICHIVMYSAWPLFSAILLPAFGKSNTVTKVIHCVIASGVPIMFTSTTLEPLTFLIVLGYTAGWAATESYYTISSWDNLRRMIILVYLFILIEQLTATGRLSFKCLICDTDEHTEIFVYILSLTRLLIVYTSVLTTFRLILGSQIYSIAILASLVLCIAALRVLLTITANSLMYAAQIDNSLHQHIRVNAVAIIFILGYSAAMIYARNNRHISTPSSLSFDLRGL